MTYEEAKNKVDEYKHLFGEPLGIYKVKYMIISTQERLKETLSLFIPTGFDNKSALVQLGMINQSDLDVFLLTQVYTGDGVFDELENYLSKHPNHRR